MFEAKKALLLGLTFILLTGCTTSGRNVNSSPTFLAATEPPPTSTATAEPPTATATTELPSPTAAPTETPTLDLTSTLAALLSVTPLVTPELTATATTAPTGNSAAVLPGVVNDSVRIYFIQQKTGGPICGDSLVPVQTHIPRSKDVLKDIASALSLLFSYKGKYVGNLYNPLYASNLSVSRVEFSGPDEVTVRLTGTVSRTKDKCDNTRLKSQIWSTVTQFKKDVKRAIIFLNNGLLGDMISNDG